MLATAGVLLTPFQAIASEHHGQVTFGGVPVPGVVVTAAQGDKKMTAVTNDVGLYAFPDLPDGTWTLDVQMTGFAPVKQDVTVAPNGAADKIELKAMSLDELRAAVKPIKVDPSAVIAATPTPSPASIPEAPGAAGSKSTAGAKPQQQASAGTPGAPPPPPPQDAAAQQANDGFLINGSVNNAATSQYAQSQAIGNARNGGRSLYNWGLFATLDNAALDAKSYSLTDLNSPKPSYTNLQLGANFGGPLHFKTFIPLSKAPYVYLMYQRGTTTDATTNSVLLPTLAERSGNFSGLGVNIFAPKAGLSSACLAAGVTPGQQFAGNIIPTPCISAAAVRLLQLYPTPNVTGNPQFNYQVPLTTDSHSDAFRSFVQKNIGNKNFLNGSVQWRSQRTGANNLFGFHDNTRVTDYSVNVAWNHRFTQRINSNVNYTFSREHSVGNPFFAFRENIEAEAGINGVLTDPAYWGPPSMSFSSGFAGLSDSVSSNNRDQTHSLGGQVTWTHGRHEVAAGGDFRRQEFNYLTQQNPRGSFQFTGSATSGSNSTGSDLADLLVGIPDTSAIAYGNADKYFRQSVYDLYVRDNFRVNPELTINAGVRWEYGAPISEIKNRLVNLDFGANFTGATPVVATNPTGPVSGIAYPHSLIYPDRSGILPNISMAWRPISGSSLLVRSSYQWYNDTSVYQSTALAMAQQAPLSTSLNLDNSRCALTLTNAFSSCPSNSPDSFSVDPHLRVGYAQIWQLSMQRDLPAALQATMTYRGTKGTRGIQEILPNTYPYTGGVIDPCPSCPPVGYSYRTSNGNSTREEGIVALRRRLRNGFTAELHYTFSKSLDDDYSLGGQQGVPGSSGGSPQIAQDWLHPEAQRGLSTFDQRHVLTLSAQYTTGMGLGGHTMLSGWRGVLYKDWTVLTSLTTATGSPLTPIYAVQVPGTAYTNVIRANYNGGPIYQSSSSANNQKIFLNANAYSAPVGTWGTARRDSIEGPNQFGLNASFARTFKVHDRYSLETHFDATNVLNRVSYTSWYTTINNPSLFGTPVIPKDMRKIQATFRLRY
ncbi:MAG TPA: TonB-dependent receptor [Acidobacteriaceae bacterium]|jgi:hypothetical protein|nr:TonB-dependent receptor [Acidobacteriaceae bacterium]